jgi:hypothetical protein
MARHRVFTIITDIRTGAEEALRGVLDGTPDSVFSELAMLHFASFVILEKDRLNDKDGKPAVEDSKLLFECNIDGSIKRYLDQLVSIPTIDRIYQHCNCYRVSDSRDEKVRCLSKKVRWPQLYHVGAPYRSAESIKQDRDLRRRLDDGLDALMTRALEDPIRATATGGHQYWKADIFKPWAAWLIGVAGPALALWLAILTRESALPRLIVLLLTLCYVALALIPVVRALEMWITALPELRDRVRPWIRWFGVGVVWSILVRVLWDQHRQWAIGLSAAFVVLVSYNAYAAVRRRSNERLLAIRSDPAAPSILSVWTALRQLAPAANEGPDWFERLLNWTAWPVAYLLVLIPVGLMAPHPWIRAAVLTLLFLAKASWLSVLLGWPGNNEKVAQDYTKIVLFIVGVPIVAFAGLAVLSILQCPSWFLALIVLVSVFSLWAVPLPSPAVDFEPLHGTELAKLVDQEDRDVQNHMAAVVELPPRRWYCVPVLKSFLWLLNRLFFRCWLPDLYRGKLFGIPTVQFCQWIVLDKRNYLFLSNYDNSWTSYLDDFGLQLTTGIQKIWGQGVHSPGTQHLGRFKDFARRTMVPHSLWYRAYPGLTLRQVWNNEQIRRGLTRAAGEEAMVDSVRRFGAAPKILPDPFHARVN